MRRSHRSPPSKLRGRWGSRTRRCVVLIEASEESGSCDLPAHVEALADRIGTPSLIVCLDSGCLDYDRLWVTTSLRGLLAGQLDVSISTEGVHSGDASGVIPSTFRIARQILSRIEDEDTGEIILGSVLTEIPPDRAQQAVDTAAEMSGDVAAKFPMLPGTKPVTDDPTEQLLNRTWRSQLEITGADGIPPVQPGRQRAAGDAPRCTSRCASHPLSNQSRRTRASSKPSPATRRTARPSRTAPTRRRPDGMRPTFAPWLETSLNNASLAAFGKKARAMGEGGSISFMGMLGHRFPEAQFVVTGVLGPGANAHGPNEFLHLPTARKLTAVIATVLRDHANR